ncbi:IclR family transcriptional regulator [Candidatus Calescamantes bacterium]|nr:IclR family transcriptional regulator [Candidatus Calescamantes bacterium]
MGKRYWVIGSLDKGLSIMEYLSSKCEGVSLNEIASSLQMEKSSTFRLLSTLSRRNFVRQDESTKKYTLGFKILELQRSLSSQLKLEKESYPFLQELTNRTGESSHIAVYSQEGVTFIATHRCDEVLSVYNDVGRREPLHCTALGKVLLSFLSEEKKKEVLKTINLEKFTSRTITSCRQLQEELKRVKEKGVAVDNEEYREGVRCVAAPVFNSDNKVIAAIGISGPSTRISPERFSSIEEIVKDVARKLSSSLGASIEHMEKKR